MDYENFRGDAKTLQAVIFNFIVIGEASAAIPSKIREQYSNIPWAEMKRFRNFVIHEYENIDPQVVWTTSKEDLPPLVPFLEQIVASKNE